MQAILLIYPVLFQYNAGANVDISDGHSVNIVEGGSYDIATGGEVSFYPSADNTGEITAVPAGTTLTIGGEGSLNASSGGRACGIGGRYIVAAGNIVINGGTITATGGRNAAGIGSGYSSACGTIEIKNAVTQVIVKKGSNAPNSIGAGLNGRCGIITIGGKQVDPITLSPYMYRPYHA